MSEENVVNHRLIKELSADDRPRERAIAYGVDSLTNAELIAIIFSTGIKGKSVIELSEDILRDNGGHVSMVGRLSVEDFLMRYKGIGKAKAVTLLAAIELGKRAAADASLISQPQIRQSSDAYNIMRPHLTGLNHEEFWILLLSRSNKVLARRRIGQGGTGATVTDVKIIAKEAVVHLASSMIVFHNHPSGTLYPSPQDDELTRRIRSAVELFDIRLNDHIIVTDNGYYSYNDQGRL